MYSLGPGLRISDKLESSALVPDLSCKNARYLSPDTVCFKAMASGEVKSGGLKKYGAAAGNSFKVFSLSC